MTPYLNFAFGRRPAEELYDLRTDPHQLKNVASEASFQQIRADLSDRLLAVLKKTGDPRVDESGQLFDTPPYAGIVEK